MLKISCSILEKVRANPMAYGELIAVNNIKARGSYGMFSCWKDIARQIHVGKYSFNEGVTALKKKFSNYEENSINRAKQNRLLNQLSNYFKNYEAKEFEYISANKHIKWDIIPDVHLTGYTPWTVKNTNGFYAFILVENNTDWKSELRYPLLQQYLVNNVVKCGVADMSVGIYNLGTDNFDFINFPAKSLKEAVLETSEIFKTVHNQYKRKTNTANYAF
jgi:hypothetical protein